MSLDASIGFIYLQLSSLQFAYEHQQPIIRDMIASRVRSMMLPMVSLATRKQLCDFDRLQDAQRLYDKIDQMTASILRHLSRQQFADLFAESIENVFALAQSNLLDSITTASIKEARKELNLKITHAVMFCKNEIV